MRSLSLFTLLAIAGTLPAQACGSLAISGSGSPGSQLQFDVSGGAAGEIAILVVGPQAGATSVPLPMGGSLVLGLAEPYYPVPIGPVDVGGAASLAVQVPAALGLQLSLHGQAVLIGYSRVPFALHACASNVVPFAIG